MNGETRTRSVGTTCSWSQRSLTWLTHGSAISRSRNAKKTANDLPAKAVTLEVFSKGLGFRELCLKQSPSDSRPALILCRVEMQCLEEYFPDDSVVRFNLMGQMPYNANAFLSFFPIPENTFEYAPNGTM